MSDDDGADNQLVDRRLTVTVAENWSSRWGLYSGGGGCCSSSSAVV